MNYYGIFMAIGWLLMSYNLEINNRNNEICSYKIEYISFLGVSLTILGSKLFQKLYRNTWQGNASFGAFYGSYVFLCLISQICIIENLLNNLSFTAPILFLLIRIGNFCNQEHYDNKYFALIEGFCQGLLPLIIMLIYKFENPIIFFIIFISIIRIISEFKRNDFDHKNIIFSLLTITCVLHINKLINYDSMIISFFFVDLISKYSLDASRIVRNYGFNFGLLSKYKEHNLSLHIIILILLLFILIKNKLLFYGSLSNLIDRLINSFIIDYINIPIKPFSNYWFNIGDIMISLGTFLILF